MRNRLRCAVPCGIAGKLAAIPPGQPLIPSRTGGHLTADSISDLIAREFRRAGSPWRAHSLRHLCATELLAATGGDITAVADQLGHRDIRTTAGYTKINAGTVRAALEQLQAHQNLTFRQEDDDVHW